MKITRSVRIPLQLSIEGGQGQHRQILASELADTLNRIVPTLPANVRVDPVAPVPQMMGGWSLVLAWDEELPAAAERS